MSSKAVKEESKSVQLTPRCLSVILKERKKSKSADEKGASEQKKCASPSETTPEKGNHVQKQPTGFELFELFQEENKTCYWNPHLEESVKNIKYVGFLNPCVLLISGRDIYLDTIRNAWGRRAVNPPPNHVIQKIGELNFVEMQVIPQTQFTPLPEALCMIISELNKSEKENGTGMSSLDMILDSLRDRYRGIQQPSEQIVYETLGILIKERKVYHTGNGYYIVTPDTYHLNGCVRMQDNQLVIGAEAANGQMPTIFIPLVTPNKTEMRSISCQTQTDTPGSPQSGDSEYMNESTSPEKEEDKKGKKFERSQSMRNSRSKDKKEKEALQRSNSLRYSEEKSKGVVKDINLKTSAVHQDKDKGKKTSVLNKLFGRNKKKTANVIEEDTSKSLSLDESQEQTVEHATFSAQFPPPEWNWESQIQNIVHKHVPKSHTWQHFGGGPLKVEMGTQSEFEEDFHRPHTLPAGMMGNPLNVGQGHGRPRARSSSQSSRSSSLGGIPEFRNEDSFEGVVQRRTKSHSRKGHRKSKRNSSAKDGPFYESSLQCNEPYLAPNSQTPTGRPHSISYNEIDRSFPDYSHHEYENLPCPPCPVHGDMYRDLGQPAGQSTPRDQGQEKNSFERPSIKENQGSGKFNSRHSKVFRKYKEMQCSSFSGNDITIKYNGRMPKKGSGVTMSRDSGVNCVGLGSNVKKQPTVNENALQNNHRDNGKYSSQNDIKLDMHNSTTAAPQLKPLPQTGRNVTVLKAEVHQSLEMSHQDSGFNSSLSHATDQTGSHQPHPCHPAESNNRSFDTDARTEESRHTYESIPADHVSPDVRPKTNFFQPQKKVLPPPKLSKVESGKKSPKLPSASCESIPISCSAKYPPYNNMGKDSHDSMNTLTTQSSGKSSSGKITVIETNLGKKEHIKENHPAGRDERRGERERSQGIFNNGMTHSQSVPQDMVYGYPPNYDRGFVEAWAQSQTERTRYSLQTQGQAMMPNGTAAAPQSHVENDTRGPQRPGDFQVVGIV